MQRLGARGFGVALAVSAGHLITAEPRRRRLAALIASEAEQPPSDAAPSGALGG